MVLPVKEAGGWSAECQMCDKIHGFFRARCDTSTDALLGFSDDAFHRHEFHNLWLNGSGIANTTVSVTDALAACAAAWTHMPTCLFQWAWISTGFVSKEAMAAETGLTVEQVGRAVEEGAKQNGTRGSIVADSDALWPFSRDTMDDILGSVQPGEVRYIWQLLTDVEKPDQHASWVNMPVMMAAAVERTLAQYMYEKRSLESGVANEVMDCAGKLDMFLKAGPRLVLLNSTTGKSPSAQWIKQNTARGPGGGLELRLKPMKDGRPGRLRDIAAFHVDGKNMTVQLLGVAHPQRIRCLKLTYGDHAQVPEHVEAPALAALLADYAGAEDVEMGEASDVGMDTETSEAADELLDLCGFQPNRYIGGEVDPKGRARRPQSPPPH